MTLPASSTAEAAIARPQAASCPKHTGGQWICSVHRGATPLAALTNLPVSGLRPLLIMSLLLPHPPEIMSAFLWPPGTGLIRGYAYRGGSGCSPASLLTQRPCCSQSELCSCRLNCTCIIPGAFHVSASTLLPALLASPASGAGFWPRSAPLELWCHRLSLQHPPPA